MTENDEWERKAREHVRELRLYDADDDEDSTVTNNYVVQGSLHVGKTNPPPWEKLPRWAKVAMSALAAAGGLAGACKALWDVLHK